MREIERGLLISEEILRHLVTVLEDRGPADEIAPAVAQRASSDLTMAMRRRSTADDEDRRDRRHRPRPRCEPTTPSHEPTTPEPELRGRRGRAR